MAAKTRFEKLPKRDRDEVLRMRDLHVANYGSLETHASVGLARVRDTRDRSGACITAISQLASALCFLKWHVRDHGIIFRLLDDSPKQQEIGFTTAARLGLLNEIAGGPERSGGYDCLHVLDFLIALATSDNAAIEAFKATFPGPFRDGHRTTVLLANGVYAIARAERVSYAPLEAALRARPETRYFKAALDGVAAIMCGDREGVTTALTTMVAVNRGQKNWSSMEKLICIHAHGLYNLSLAEFSQRGIDAPEPPEGATWDAPFHDHIHSRVDGAEPPFFDFSALNPVLANWMHDLPDKLDLDALLSHVKSDICEPSRESLTNDEIDKIVYGV